jgi:isopenicillin-N N-acyltransferase-like protein
MPEIKNKFLRRLLIATGIFFLILTAGIIYMFCVALESPPHVADKSALKLERKEIDSTMFISGNSWFRKSKSGLYEMYVEGKPFERGVIMGKLAKELVVRQEDHFNEQINKLIPSKFYLHFLKYFVGWFNRNLAENITEEYKEEIYGISTSASHRYEYIGSNYQRLLNYHAAHDIGHALQSMAMVGCTSFGTWNEKSADSTMILGRNFDFYVGDKFAEDKIVAFINPDKGYKLMYITWGGFIGVVSGMNEKGLTLTLNAAKSGIPSGSATPVSLVGREILQYAKNINEAVAIARKRKMFVSESFLIGSAEDHKAVIIEKTPDTLDVYDPKLDYILCANHFQSDGLKNSPANVQQIKESASDYRYKRLTQLMNNDTLNTAEATVAILRDRKGINNRDIGLGNEKTLNQFLAHHSIIFEPEKKLVWVSTAPWQLGPFECYNLEKVFSLKGLKKDVEIADSAKEIPADPFIYTAEYKRFILYRKWSADLADGKPVNINNFISSNPEYYHTYVLAGDYYFRNKNYKQANQYYTMALTKEIATLNEKNSIMEKLKKCREKTSD